jgi:tetratricopeptide (TPR) repeat protein
MINHYRILTTLALLTIISVTAAAQQKSQCPDASAWDISRPQTVIPAFKSPDVPEACVSALLSLLADNGEGGKIPAADTLYGVLDAAGRLDAAGLLGYGRVKCLVGDYRAAAAIYCRAAADKRLEPVAVTQMEQLFADADSAQRSAALRGFRNCALSRPGADTVFYRNRLADFYGQRGHFGEEISILTALSIPSAPAGPKLAEVAWAHFAARRYRFAAAAAAAAYDRLEVDAQTARVAAALTAYRAYLQLNARDSALIWLRLSGAADKDAAVQAVALNQEAGHREEAARLLETLPVSLHKDTLAVRGYVFAGEIDKALNSMAASNAASWIINPRERMLWRARCLIFRGQPYDAAPTLDSIKFAASWQGTSEALRYRYWLQKLDEDGVPRGAQEAWGKLEYRIYTGDLSAAAKGLKDFFDTAGGIGGVGGSLKGMFDIKAGTGAVGEALAVRLCGALSSRSRHAEALEALEMAADGRTPEYLYAKAETLKELGRRDDAKNAAQRILKEYPADVFAQKARILLAGM